MLCKPAHYLSVDAFLVLGDVGGGEETMQGLDGGGPRSPPVPLKPSISRPLEEKEFSSEVREVASACMASVAFMLGGGKRDETSAAVARLRPMVLEASAEFQAKALGTPRCPVASQGGAAGSRIARGKHFFDTVKPLYFERLEAEKVELARVALPALGLAGTAEMLRLLPTKWAKYYADPESLLLPRTRRARGRQRRKKPAFLVEGKEYAGLVELLFKRGMISFVRPGAVRSETGLFAVPKDSEQRLINDCRPTNEKQVDPPPLELPGPDLLSQLQADGPVVCWKYDVASCFHRIRLPEVWWPFFALPAVSADVVAKTDFGGSRTRRSVKRGMWHPVFTVLPMGWKFAPHICQEIHMEVVRRAVGGVRFQDLICTQLDRRVDRPRFLIYLDDGAGLAPVSKLAEALELFGAILTALADSGLSTKLAKNLPPAVQVMKCLGMRWDGADASFAPPVEGLLDLMRVTEQLVRAGWACPKALQSIVGRWVWYLLPSRLALSVLSSTYRFAEVFGTKAEPVALWSSVAKELRTLVGLAPLLRCSWRRPFLDFLTASDASETGGGVSVSRSRADILRVFSAELWSYWRRFPSEGQFDITADADAWMGQRGENPLVWRHVVSRKFRFKQGIAVLEARAAVDAVRRVLDLKERHRRFSMVLFVDNTVVVGGLTKGRSKSHDVLVQLRFLAVYALVYEIRLLVVYIPSASNPADEPSRAV